MTAPRTQRHERAPVAELVVVHVRDAINPALAGHGDAELPEPAAAAR